MVALTNEQSDSIGAHEAERLRMVAEAAASVELGTLDALLNAKGF